MELKMSNQIGIATNEILPLQMKNTENSLIELKSYEVIKRTADVVISSVSLIFLAPLFLIISLFIKKESKNNVIYSQTRIGKDGKLFKLYKFRTMVPDADKKLDDLLANDESAREEYKINKKLKNDPRITKVGKFLRKTSLDELPQLFNVLKGEMSLIGPRPYLVKEKEDMENYYRYIIQSKPGITGLWQVSGRSNTTFKERLKIDLEYNGKKSLKEDTIILFKTISVIFKKEGAV